MSKSIPQQKRDLELALIVGAITRAEYDKAIRDLEIRFRVLGWSLVVIYSLGLLVAVALTIGGAWGFISFVAFVGTYL